MLVAGELNKPASILYHFSFLSGKVGRGIFELFVASLCLTQGFSGSGQVADIFIIIVGFLAFICAILTMCYGIDHDVGASEEGGLFRTGGGIFQRRGATSHPSTTI